MCLFLVNNTLLCIKKFFFFTLASPSTHRPSYSCHTRSTPFHTLMPALPLPPIPPAGTVGDQGVLRVVSGSPVGVPFQYRVLRGRVPLLALPL